MSVEGGVGAVEEGVRVGGLSRKLSPRTEPGRVYTYFTKFIKVYSIIH